MAKTKKHLSYFENIDTEIFYAIETLLNSNKTFRTVLDKIKTKISQSCRKIIKIKPIYDIAKECRPDYDCDRVYNLLKEAEHA